MIVFSATRILRLLINSETHDIEFRFASLFGVLWRIPGFRSSFTGVQAKSVVSMMTEFFENMHAQFYAKLSQVPLVLTKMVAVSMYLKSKCSIPHRLKDPFLRSTSFAFRNVGLKGVEKETFLAIS